MTLLLALSLVVSWSAAATPGVVGELEQSAETTPKQKAEFVTSALGEITAGVATVEKLLEAARTSKEKDKEEIDCLEAKLPQMKTILEVAKKANTSMETNLANSDLTHADQEYRQVAVLLSRSREFLADAQQCVKSAGTTSGKTASSLSQDDSANTIDDLEEIFPDLAIETSPV